MYGKTGRADEFVACLGGVPKEALSCGGCKSDNIYAGSPITANVTFFLTAFLTSILIFFGNGQFDTLNKIKEVPVYLYLTGFISAFMILGTTCLIPHLGARKFFILLISGQIIMAVVISHFGILESPKDPISMKKLIGASAVVTGAFISTN
jgi:transporter family-2 protein